MLRTFTLPAVELIGNGNFTLSGNRNALTQLEKYLLKKGCGQVEDILRYAELNGSLSGYEGQLENAENIFITALELSPQAHLAHVAAFQRFVDDSVSKTVNLPTAAKPRDIKSIYMQAYKLGLRGITVYRNTSRQDQPRDLANVQR